jgi:hypothetical protein
MWRQAALEDFQLAAGCGWSGGGDCCWVGRSWGKKCIAEIYITVLPGGIAVSKLRMATWLTVNLRLIEAMMVSMMGLSPLMVGL